MEKIEAASTVLAVMENGEVVTLKSRQTMPPLTASEWSELCAAVGLVADVSVADIVSAIQELKARIYRVKEQLAAACPEADPSRTSLEDVVHLLFSDVIDPLRALEAEGIAEVEAQQFLLDTPHGQCRRYSSASGSVSETFEIDMRQQGVDSPAEDHLHKTVAKLLKLGFGAMKAKVGGHEVYLADPFYVAEVEAGLRVSVSKTPRRS